MVLGPTVRMWLPYLNFTVTSSALCFQTAVLYPWHHELDREFKKLKTEHKEILQHYHEVNIQKFEDLERRVVLTEHATTNSGGRGGRFEREGGPTAGLRYALKST